MRMRSVVCFVAAAAVVSGAVVASQQSPRQKEQPQQKEQVKLKVGDKAPKLTVDKWLKGQAVNNFEAGKVYVVEFWATWCPPCVASIPHLTELQKKHKDAVVIGLAGSERGDGNNIEQKLSKFVKDQGAKMEYRVAFEGKRKMATDWLQAAGQDGIPCAFIVDHEGKIAYIGHPMGMDDAFDAAMKAVTKKSDKPEKSDK